MSIVSYEQDITDAALSPSAFDKVNAAYIADSHGEDPKVVLADIRNYRSNMREEA